MIQNATWDANGRWGGSLYFDSNSVVEVPDGSWNRGTPMTYIAWYRMDGATGGYVFEHEFGGTAAGGFALDRAELMSFRANVSATIQEGVTDPAGVSPGVWTMAAAVVADGELRLYRDGQLVGETETTSAVPELAGPLFFGARGSEGDGYFRGWIDEVKLYKRALTEAELQTIYQRYQSPDLVGHWSFDETSGTTAADQSGEGNHGAAQSVTWDPNGRVGGAVYFNGTNGLVTIPEGSWNQGTPMTFNLWYKIDGGAATVSTVALHFGVPLPGSFALDRPYGMRFAVGDGIGALRTVSNPSGVVPGIWTMATLVATTTELRLYRDGQLASTSPIQGGLPRLEGPLYFGARGTLGDSYFRGWLDDTKIYRRALSAVEVQALYAEYAACHSGNCGNGEGPCTSNLGCAAGLVCGYGIGPRFGLPADVGVCWNPGVCATLESDECGDPGDVCGDDCCVPECGPGAGSDDGCGNSCSACVAGADSDADGIGDCSERADDDPWTDHLVFNGVLAERGESCHASPLCSEIDADTELRECFEPLEESRIQSGWDFATTDDNICDAGFDFAPGWMGCGEDFGVNYTAALRLEDRGFHCFAITGSTSSQCGAFFFDGAPFGVTSNQSTICRELNAGIYPVSWFYETTSSSTNELHVDYCFSATAPCTPTDAIPPHIMRPIGDVGDRVCGSDCTEICRCAAGGSASTELECLPDLELRTDRWQRFGYSTPTSVCWDPICDNPSSELFECGTTSSRCGLCTSCTPSCAGRSCGFDGCRDTCGDGICEAGQQGCDSHDDCAAGLRCIPSGSASVPNTCRSAICENPSLNPCSDLENAGEATECGTCPICVPDCTGRQCGDDGCGGTCGDPGPNEFCTGEGYVQGVLGDATVQLPADLVPEDAASVSGSLDGTVTVTPFGQASYTIPIKLPPGRNGIEPRLTLSYNSDSGNNYLGMGWSLSGLSSIQRCPRTIAQDGEAAPITYTTDDRFCLDGNRLLLSDEGDHEYGEAGSIYFTEFQTFSKIVVEGGPDEPESFKAYAADGRILTYAKKISGGFPIKSQELRDFNASFPVLAETVTHTWALTRVEDRFQNALEIEYWTPRHCPGFPLLPCLATGGSVREYYPKRIRYTSHPNRGSDRVVDFHYRERTEPLRGYQNGVRVERNQLLETITARVLSPSTGETEAFRYNFEYDEPPVGSGDPSYSNFLSRRTTLVSIQQCARSSIRATTADSCKPATQLEYWPSNGGFASHDTEVATFPATSDEVADHIGAPLVLDLDGNGQSDIVYSVCHYDRRNPRASLDWRLILNGIEQPETAGFERMVAYGYLESAATNVHVPASAFVVDIDLDGRDEILEIDSAFRHSPTTVRVLELDAGALSRETSLDLGPAVRSGNVYALDAQGDGLTDLVTCTPSGSAFHWALRSGIEGAAWAAPTSVTNDGPACGEGTGVDLNGDGRQEILLSVKPASNGSISQFYSGLDADIRRSTVLWPLTGVTTNSVLPARVESVARLVMDANGDGLPDVVDIDTSFGMQIWANSGAGFISEGRQTLSLSVIDDAYSAQDFSNQLRRFAVPFDENSDGRMDLVVRVSDDQWAILRSTGTSFALHEFYVAPPADGPITHVPEPIYPSLGNRFIAIDHNQDGVLDLMAHDGVRIRRGSNASRLRSITNGVGARTEIGYADVSRTQDEITAEYEIPIYHGTYDSVSCAYPCYARRPSGDVVRTISLWDQPYDEQDATKRMIYYYAYGASNLEGRGHLGFGSIGVIDDSRFAVARLSGGYQVNVSKYRNNIFSATRRLHPYVGMVAEAEESATLANGRQRKTVAVRELEHVPSFAGSVFVHTASERREVFETPTPTAPAGNPLNRVVSEWDYDAYGNVTLATVQWSDDLDDNSNDRESLETDYVLDSEHVDRWLIRSPRLETREARRNIDGATSQRQFVYSEDPESTSSLDYTGMPESVTSVREADPAHPLKTTIIYDEFGNVEERIEDGWNGLGHDERTTVFEQDDAELFNVSMTDDRGRVTEMGNDVILGLPVTVRKEGHYLEHITEYAVTDGFGRLRRTVDASGIVTRTDYGFGFGGGYTMSSLKDGGASEVVAYDVLARPISKVVQGFSGPLVTSTSYNAQGLVERISRTHSSSGSIDADYTTFTYDALGREISRLLPNGDSATSCYQNNASCVRDPRGYSACRVFNEHGELAHDVVPNAGDMRACSAVLSEVVNDFPAEDLPISSARYDATSYEYGPHGAIKTIVDPLGNEIIFSADDLGRIVSRYSRDSGPWSYVFNAFGEIASQTGPDDATTHFRYDGVGRVIERVDGPIPGSGGADESTLFLHDYLLGDGFNDRLIATVTHDGVVTAMSYDDAGRLESLTRVIDSLSGEQTLSRQYHYDGDSRLSLVEYGSENGDSPLRIRYRYNTYGQLERVTIPDPTFPGDAGRDSLLWRATSATAYGQLETEVFGNGVSTTRTYRPDTGYLWTLESQHESTQLQDLEYFYDRNGNTLSRLETNGAEQRLIGYDYDGQNRLTAASTIVFGSSGWATVFSEAYSYDELGNIKTKGTSDLVSGSSDMRVYEYDRFSGARPNLLRAVDGDLTQNYQYDEFGRLTLRHGSPQSTVRVAYNRSGMPIELGAVIGGSGSTIIQYDATSTRVRKVTDDVETVYLDDVFSRKSSTSSSGYVERMSITVFGRNVAEIVRDAAGNDTITYLHTERTGSVHVMTDEDGDEVERRTYEAYGLRRDVTGGASFETRSDFTGHELDAEYGFINMKARLYDPVAGRFVMPDPVALQSTAIGLNPYAYASNNPQKFADSMGMFPTAFVSFKLPNANESEAVRRIRGTHPLSGIAVPPAGGSAGHRSFGLANQGYQGGLSGVTHFGGINESDPFWAAPAAEVNLGEVDFWESLDPNYHKTIAAGPDGYKDYNDAVDEALGLDGWSSEAREWVEDIIGPRESAYDSAVADTFGIVGSGSGGLGLGVGGNGLIIQDSNGTGAVLLGVSGGASYGAGVGAGWHWSNADTVDSLTGWGGSFGGSLGLFGIEVIYGSGFMGLNLTLGIELEYHSSIGYTWMASKREPWQSYRDSRYQFRDHYDSESGMCK